MKFLIVIAALVAVSSAQYLRDFGAVVEGPKAVIAGPSGTISADTGSIVKSPETRLLGAPAAIIAPRTIVDAPLYAPRTVIGAPLFAPRTVIGAPLLAPAVTRSFVGSPLLGSYGYGARSFIDSPYLATHAYGARGLLGLGHTGLYY